MNLNPFSLVKALLLAGAFAVLAMFAFGKLSTQAAAVRRAF